MISKSQDNTAYTTPYLDIDKAIRTLDGAAIHSEGAAAADDLNTRLEKLVKVYGSIKPLLVAVSALPIVPAKWQTALVLFTQTVDAVVASPEIDSDFKSGKDL